jgi:predicted ATPase
MSNEVRRLTAKWDNKAGWPKRLDWIEINGLRGWTGNRISFDYPIIAVVGENGVGKSTVLQAAAAVYKSTAPKHFIKGRGFASDFFPKTAWDEVGDDAQVRYGIREPDRQARSDSIRKSSGRWRGNTGRWTRPVVYIDLSRIQPVAARVGYPRIAKTPHTEISSSLFDATRLSRLSQIMGRSFELAKMALTNIDHKRQVPVLSYHGSVYSGFHQGAGETTMAELLQADFPQNSLVLIDEVESSLHPRSQRRLIRDLAERCRERELQIIMTTHSPFILDELPQRARAYIVETNAGRRILYGVSPEFAMSKMDDVPQYECDLYVEDNRAKTLLIEIMAAHRPDLVLRCRVVPYGAASVGLALGIMVSQDRFPRPTCVFLDADQPASNGCVVLPGDDTPEQVVFTALKSQNWLRVAERVGRPHASVADACSNAMTLADHHDWVTQAATSLRLGGDTLWQAMASEWATKCLSALEVNRVLEPVEDALIKGTNGQPQGNRAVVGTLTADSGRKAEPAVSQPDFSKPSGTSGSLFEV